MRRVFTCNERKIIALQSFKDDEMAFFFLHVK